MDLTIRDWMVIVGVLLIFAVLVDAWRRVRSERRAPVKLDLAKPYDSENPRDDSIDWLKELPNGGARVVERRDLVAAAAKSRDEAYEAADAAAALNRDAESAPDENREDSEDEIELVTGMSSNQESENLD